MSGTRGDLTTAPLSGLSFRFGLPLALGMAGHGLFNLVDMTIVARLGPGAVAAVTIGGVILPVAMLLFDGVNSITAALVAQYRGAGHLRRAHDLAWESLALTAAGGLLFGAALAALAGPIVRWFSLGSPEIESGAIGYLAIMAGGMVGMLLMLQTTAILRGLGDGLRPMVILVGANLVNLLLDWLLVFGEWGFPRLGVRGAAWATIIAQILGAAAGLWLLWRGDREFSLRSHRWRGPALHVRVLLLKGLPASLQLVGRVLAVFFLLRIARAAAPGPGHQFMDGLGICIRLEMIAVFLGLGWAAAATPVVGQNLGAGLSGRAARGTWWLVGWAGLSMASAGGVLWVLREPLLSGIMPDLSPGAEAAAEVYLRITVPAYALIAVALVLARALNGAGSTRTAMALDLVLYLGVLLPAASLLAGADGPSPDPAGAWRALTGVHILAAVAFAAVFATGRWKTKRLLAATVPSEGADSRPGR